MMRTPQPVTTFFDKTLQSKLGGIYSGLSIVYGNPGTGKTTFALNIVASCLAQNKTSALYIDTEYGISDMLVTNVAKAYDINPEDLHKIIVHENSFVGLKQRLYATERDNALKLVVIDTLSTLIAAESVNLDPKFKYSFFAERYALPIRLHKVGIEQNKAYIIIAHRKKGKDEIEDDDEYSEIYGIGKMANYQARRIILLNDKLELVKDQNLPNVKFEFEINGGRFYVK